MKRRVVRILLLLVAGAIVNVAVAWGCAIASGADMAAFRSPVSGLGRFVDGRSEIPTEVFRDVDAAEHHRLRLHEFIPPYVARDYENRLRTDEYMGVGYRQTWYMPRYVDLSGFPHYFAIGVAAGWPMLCLDGLAVCEEGYWPTDVSKTIEVGAWRTTSDLTRWPDTVMPGTPLWPGFAINTLFYAAILWLLFAAPFALRRRFRGGRIKRGLCPACAYPIGDSPVCTECGKPVAPKAMAV